MFKFFSKKPKSETESKDPNEKLEPSFQPEAKSEKQSLFSRLKSQLGKTRERLTGGLADLILGKKTLDEDLLEEIETQLISADVGVATTTKIITDLTQKVSRKELKDPKAVLTALKTDMVNILAPCQKPFTLEVNGKAQTPFVLLMVGVNGAGKTTTIGKLAKHFLQNNKSVMLAAGDTFRAAAVEQLKVWGERNNVPVVAQAKGSDSASVIFDALASAKAKNIDLLIADTAGRLHTQSHLMQELQKILRVIKKQDATAPHEIMLVLDAGIGQNAIMQAKSFTQSLGVTGLAITKLDGTAKGGVIFAIADELKLPIRYIGVGEKIDDLQEFNAQSFVDALFG